MERRRYIPPSYKGATSTSSTVGGATTNLARAKGEEETKAVDVGRRKLAKRPRSSSSSSSASDDAIAVVESECRQRAHNVPLLGVSPPPPPATWSPVAAIAPSARHSDEDDDEDSDISDHSHTALTGGNEGLTGAFFGKEKQNYDAGSTSSGSSASEDDTGDDDDNDNDEDEKENNGSTVPVAVGQRGWEDAEGDSGVPSLKMYSPTVADPMRLSVQLNLDHLLAMTAPHTSSPSSSPAAAGGEASLGASPCADVGFRSRVDELVLESSRENRFFTSDILDGPLEGIHKALWELPTLHRLAVYDGKQCPFTAAQGFGPSFHTRVQEMLKRQALSSGMAADSISDEAILDLGTADMVTIGRQRLAKAKHRGRRVKAEAAARGDTVQVLKDALDQKRSEYDVVHRALCQEVLGAYQAERTQRKEKHLQYLQACEAGAQRWRSVAQDAAAALRSTQQNEKGTARMSKWERKRERQQQRGENVTHRKRRKHKGSKMNNNHTNNNNVGNTLAPMDMPSPPTMYQVGSPTPQIPSSFYVAMGAVQLPAFPPGPLM